MRLNQKNLIYSGEEEAVVHIDWYSSLEYFTYGEHLKLHMPETQGKDGPTKAVSLNSSHATCLDCMWVPQNADGRRRAFEIFSMGTSDGRCLIVHKSGRTERTIDAHKGSVLATRWNHDGTSLLTCGEDGSLKVWSRSGMLRSTHVQSESPIYTAAWSPFSTSILYTNGKNVAIQPFSAGSKSRLEWKAHESLVLSVAWCSKCNLIASGGEDCIFKIWDSQGQLLHSSSTQLHPVTCISWSPDGKTCAFATFSTVCVTTSYGGISVESFMEGDGITCLSWSAEGSQLATGNASGRIQSFYLIRESNNWSNYSVSTINSTCLEIRDIVNESVEKLEFKDDVLLISFDCGHLIVASQSQLFIYKEVNHWSGAITAELRDRVPQFIKQCEKYFILMDFGQIFVFGYDGTLISSPKVTAQRLFNLTTDQVSAAKELLAIRSPTDPRGIFCCQLRTGKSVFGERPFTHSCDITQLELDSNSNVADQILAFVDSSRDCYLLLATPAPTSKLSKLPLKIASGISCLSWNWNCCMLALIKEDELVVVPYPPALFTDPSLMERFCIRQSLRQYGKNLKIEKFASNHLTLRRSDGLRVPLYLPPYPYTLQEFAVSGQWQNAQRLCSSVKIDLLWCCLAAMAIHFKQLNAARIAYAALCETDKVLFINSILKNNQNEHQSALLKAGMALLHNNRLEAETILLQSGLSAKAVVLNLQLLQFDRALELALKHDTSVDLVLAHRRKYLEHFGWSETNLKFIQTAKKLDIDWENVDEKLSNELQWL